MDISTNRYNEVVAVGDFNIDLLTVNRYCRLPTIFRDAGMKQIISSPTRVTRCSSALLDHVYVKLRQFDLRSRYRSMVTA